MYGPSAAIGELPVSQAPRRDQRREAESPAFAQQIAAFYPYPSPAPVRPEDVARTDVTRGPTPPARYPGLAQRRHGRGSG